VGCAGARALTRAVPGGVVHRLRETPTARTDAAQPPRRGPSPRDPPGMTIPNPTDAPTLLTDADVLTRVRPN